MTARMVLFPRGLHGWNLILDDIRFLDECFSQVCCVGMWVTITMLFPKFVMLAHVGRWFESNEGGNWLSFCMRC